MRTCERLDFEEERQMNAEHATPEVIDALARIEIERREKEKESGVPVSCNWALGKLYELLPGERKSPGANPGTALQADIEAATLAIGRLREFARTPGRHATLKVDHPSHPHTPCPDPQTK